MTAHAHETIAQTTEWKLPRAVKGTVLAPSDMPEGAYALQLDGDCMEPLASDGAKIILEPRVPETGEMACFWFEGGRTPALKILDGPLMAWPVHPDSNLVPMIQVKQINPVKRFTVMGDVVKAIHRVWAVQDVETGEWKRMEACDV